MVKLSPLYAIYPVTGMVTVWNAITFLLAALMAHRRATPNACSRTPPFPPWALISACLAPEARPHGRPSSLDPFHHGGKAAATCGHGRASASAAAISRTWTVCSAACRTRRAWMMLGIRHVCATLVSSGVQWRFCADWQRAHTITWCWPLASPHRFLGQVLRRCFRRRPLKNVEVNVQDRMDGSSTHRRAASSCIPRSSRAVWCRPFGHGV